MDAETVDVLDVMEEASIDDVLKVNYAWLHNEVKYHVLHNDRVKVRLLEPVYDPLTADLYEERKGR